MELMSLLLFCVLIVYLPHTLGVRDDHFDLQEVNDIEIKFNNTIIIEQKPQQKKVYLNVNAPPLITSTVTHKKQVFQEKCKKCIGCMEQAVKSYKTYSKIGGKRQTTADLYTDILSTQYETIPRLKRNSNKSELKPETHSKRRRRSKKKQSKSVTVTKYSNENDIYAIKVKEFVSHKNETLNDIQTCTVYGISKSYDCFTPAANSFLEAHKRKRYKKENRTHLTTTTQGPLITVNSYKKRQMELIQVPEDFALSIEDLV